MDNPCPEFDFSSCVETLRRDESSHQRDSIGLLREKILHRALKEYYISLYPEAIPEEKVGSYRADLFLPRKNTIIEIQTGSFFPLKKKIAYYLESTDAQIIIVHPLAAKKYVYWIDERDGSVSEPHKSPKKISEHDALREIFWLSDFIENPRLSFDILLMELDEYRLLSGWSADRKRGSDRYEFVPVRLIDRKSVRGKDDVRSLFPDLPEYFCQKDMARVFGVRGIALSNLKNLALSVGAIEEAGKEGRAIIYRRKDF